MIRRSLLLGLLMLAACGRAEESWEGYALRDRVGANDERLIGAYGSLAGCRAALLATDSDASSEALVCTRGCVASGEGQLDTCAATDVVRPVQAPLPERDPLSPFALPAAGEARSPGSGPSRP